MAELERRSKRYLTDLTDEEWAIVLPFLPAPPKRGRKPATDLREVLNALRYRGPVRGCSKTYAKARR